ncbi:hypothetical protein [Deefgea sp. CFH1-16]|uniref:hypothetical protein n=1 Tax=Deefgea sp. CFH1-16 TaxID=2675457 RepID=UPI00194020C6|nr:hypothetical protein [Deefgea sp. CFH1-16]
MCWRDYRVNFHNLRMKALAACLKGEQIQEVALVSGHKSWKNLARYTQLRAVDLHREVVKSVVLCRRSDRR